MWNIIYLYKNIHHEYIRVEIECRAYPVEEYFMEDCVEMCNFVPPVDKLNKKQDKGESKRDWIQMRKM